MSNWSTLSPPRISAKQCQKLVDKYFQEGEPLAGRPVMIPFTKQAFVMGELQPVVMTKKSGGGDTIEHVQVRPGKDEKLQTLSTNDAKQWLLKKAQPTPATQPTPTTTVPDEPKTTPESSQSSNRTVAASAGSKYNTAKTQKKKATTTPSTTTTTSIPFHPTMVEIHEEFNQDGTQTKGDVVNVTSEFQALMEKIGGGQQGNGDAMKFPQEEEETKEDEIIIMTDYDAPLKQLTDPEYDHLAKRLDELARLEEMENERLQQGARTSKLKAKRAAAATTNKKKSSGGWNKGFLNQQPKKKKSPKKAPSTTKAEPDTTANQSQSSSSSLSSDQVTADASKTRASSSSSLPGTTSTTTPIQATTGGAVAFDLSQNKVQEIPSIPGTRPIPPRNNNNNGPSTTMPIPGASSSAMDSTTTNTNPAPRMMDSSVFSGIIQERPITPTVGGVVEKAKVNNNNKNIIPERSVPQSSFRRRRQQQQQQTPQVSDPSNKPKKKLSRFAQERMG